MIQNVKTNEYEGRRIPHCWSGQASTHYAVGLRL